ncbi:MAG: hypothetical protein ACP5N7_00230 [Candidatus Pacearchaeota archaeon]
MRYWKIRIINALKVAYVAYTNPKIMVHDSFQSLIGLWTLIYKVIEDKRPYMTHLAVINSDGEKNVLASLWAGYGENASPLGRITELIVENSKLENEIKELKAKLNEK